MTTNGNHFRVVDKAQERYAMAGKRDVHMRTMDDTEVTTAQSYMTIELQSTLSIYDNRALTVNF